LEPLERIASLSIQRAGQSQQLADFEDAAQRQQMLIARLPFSPHPYRSLGQLWWGRFEKTQDRVAAERAVTAFDAAVKRYPYHAALLAEWATALSGAGQTEAAQAAVRRALTQDDVNHRAEHTDKYLDAATRTRLEGLSDSLSRIPTN
jgi:predicted Zn-dependent protease